MRHIKRILTSLVLSAVLHNATAAERFVAFSGEAGMTRLDISGLTVVTSPDDNKGVHIAAGNLAKDFGRVTSLTPTMSSVTPQGAQGQRIVAATLGQAILEPYLKDGTIDRKALKGKWEKYIISIAPDGGIVIAGSDRRGTIYGIYEVSRQIGVSPWHFWADAPTAHHDEIYVRPGTYTDGEPKVKYRGIFINDEWPSFGTWCGKRFGGVNSRMYATMFELLLRLKANYFWPAMWASRFNEDDPLSPQVADEMGIVMGTSHHEPMMRAHKEYTTRREEIGPWNYNSNKDRLDKFFLDGMTRNKAYDNLVTIGMRGDGDVAMGDGDDEANMRTLRNVIKGQRKIIRQVYGREDAVPQLWAIFTEVQRYYDAGFSVPDDVTLLLCDNNWGYIRRTADYKNRRRKGGFGMYYHIDMNGGPWNDRWINTSPLPKLREQLSLAYRSGIDRIWIVNVGDLKPKELPIDFIMSYAWDPEAIQPGDERTFTRRWAASIFGEEVAEDCADILSKYPKYNLWRKPEVQTPGVFSVEDYDEAARVTTLWRELAEKAESLKKRIPQEAQDAYFQLVYYPAVASAGVAEIYLAATQNQYYAARNDIRANAFADRAKELFRRDSLLTAYYNKEMSGGKWDGMMQDKHIGYSKWSMPESNILPKLTYVTDAEYSIAPHKSTRNIPSADNAWIFLPDLGRSEGCMGARDVTAQGGPLGTGARMEYDIDVPKDGTVRIAVGILPTQDVNPERGLRLAMQMDDGEIQVLDARRGLVDTFNEYTPQNMARSKKLKPLPKRGTLSLSGNGRPMRNEIFDNLRWLDASFSITSPGRHTLKIIMVDPEIVVENIVVNPDDKRHSYFGPPCR